MTTINDVHPYGVTQRAAQAIGAALLRWAEHSAVRAASRKSEVEQRWSKRMQLQDTARAREQAITRRALMPRQF